MNHIILKLTGKSRNKRVMLIIELFFSFIAFFLLFTILAGKLTNTNYPLGFDYENVYKINIESSTIQKDSISDIYKYLNSYPGVEAVGKIYSSYIFGEGYMNPNGPLIYKNIKIPAENVEQIGAQDEIAKVLNLQILQGRWFNKEDNASKNRPAVINEKYRLLRTTMQNNRYL